MLQLLIVRKSDEIDEINRWIRVKESIWRLKKKGVESVARNTPNELFLNAFDFAVT